MKTVLGLLWVALCLLLSPSTFGGQSDRPMGVLVMPPIIPLFLSVKNTDHAAVRMPIWLRWSESIFFQNAFAITQEAMEAYGRSIVSWWKAYDKSALSPMDKVHIGRRVRKLSEESKTAYSVLNDYNMMLIHYSEIVTALEKSRPEIGRFKASVDGYLDQVTSAVHTHHVSLSTIVDPYKRMVQEYTTLIPQAKYPELRQRVVAYQAEVGSLKDLNPSPILERSYTQLLAGYHTVTELGVTCEDAVKQVAMSTRAMNRLTGRQSSTCAPPNSAQRDLDPATIDLDRDFSAEDLRSIQWGQLASDRMFPLGSAFLTPTGVAFPRAVIHAVSGVADVPALNRGSYRLTVDLVKSSIKNAMRLAQKNGYRSISIPIPFRPEAVGFVERIGTDSQTLTKAVVDTALENAAGMEVNFLVPSTAGEDRNVIAQAIASSPTGKMTLASGVDSIVSQHTDAIVNPAVTQGWPSGGVSRSIFGAYRGGESRDESGETPIEKYMNQLRLKLYRENVVPLSID